MWLFQATWHYRTLLAVTIECVDQLPDDCDALVNELLIKYPVKPNQSVIARHLQSSERLSRWFKSSASHHPKIIRINLESEAWTGNAECRHPKIETVGDLADWLAVTPTQLNWFANTLRTDVNAPKRIQHYTYQLLEKRDGRMRLIEKPKTNLKRIQRKIYHEILSTLEVHPAAHGFCKNRNCLSHASVHVEKQYLFVFDIAECFQSIGWPMVKAVFAKMGYPERVSNYLAALCTHKVRLPPDQFQWFDAAQRQRLKVRHLPQGAPSSPALANAALQQLDRRLTGLASHLSMDYSRYADDIAMSSNKHRDWKFLEPLIGAICLDEGLRLNYKKTRVKKPHQKQRVVGIVVNRKTNIDRKYFDTLKATLTNCSRYGLDSQNRNKHPHFRAHLYGQIVYVKSLNAQRGLKLEQIYHRIE